MKKASFEIALKGKRQVAEGTMEFVFEKPRGFIFKAGQHLRMTLINPLETDAEGNSRFMTLANTPQDADLVIAMRMRDTAFKRVLNRLHFGEKVLIEILLDVPHGAFALHDDSSKPAVFIAGGIGIIPAYSMIKDAIERKLPHKMTLFYSNRRPEDAPYLQELEGFVKQNPSFTLVATMTEQEKSNQSWHGETGVINESMLKRYVSDLQSPIYYIAGMKEMVDAMKALIIGLSVNEENIKAEEFSGFKMGEHSGPATSHPWKKHLLIAAIILIVIVVGILHVTAATSLSNIFSLKNPLFYLLIGVMLVVVPLKFKHFMSLIHSLRK